MNFMGMGMLEVMVILLVAFLALGPSRSITMARTAGKVMSDIRRTFSEVAAAAGMDEATRQARETVAALGTELSMEQPSATRTPAPSSVDRTGDQTGEQSAVGEETSADEAEEQTDQVTASETSAADGAEQLTEQATAGQDSPTTANREESAG